ncbi:MAG: hypothetical protein JRJ65_20975 [Deltaproteobacteria bacterium]|nr:hypothetical protein [Deltaproteobacteria bacterium]
MNKLTDICPDFFEWPERWMGDKADLVYGKQLLEEFEPFALSLVDRGLAIKTIKRHLTNLWLLGGEIIRDVSLSEEYSIPAIEKLRQSVSSDGGPYCRYLNSETEMNSYDSTCKKLHRFMKELRK